MNTESCIFCRIRDKQIPSSIVMENDDYFVIHDIHPKDTTHLLIISKEHLHSLNDLSPSSTQLKTLFETIKRIASLLEKPEYRIQINVGSSAGQIIFHLHVHLLSSSKLISTV